MWFLLVAALGVAHAEMPLPSYREAVVREAWHAIDDKIELAKSGSDVDVEMLAEAGREGEQFQRQVVEDGSIEYLVGLSWRLRDDVDRARKHWEHAAELDPAYLPTWYDLGEVYLIGGEFEKAEAAFEKVAELAPTKSLGHRRLAETAAHRHDAEKFEAHVREALARGFSFREIETLPNWHGFYADPAIRDSIEKLVTVYGNPATLDALRKGAEQLP